MPSTRLTPQFQLFVPNVRLTRLKDPPAPSARLSPLIDLTDPKLLTAVPSMSNLPDPKFLLSNSKPQANLHVPLRRSPKSQPTNAHPIPVTSEPLLDPDAQPTPVKSPQSTPNPQHLKLTFIDHPDLSVPHTRLQRLRLTRDLPALNLQELRDPRDPKDHPTLNKKDPPAPPPPPPKDQPAYLAHPVHLPAELDLNVLLEQSVLYAHRIPVGIAPREFQLALTKVESEDKKINYTSDQAV